MCKTLGGVKKKNMVETGVKKKTKKGVSYFEGKRGKTRNDGKQGKIYFVTIYFMEFFLWIT